MGKQRSDGEARASRGAGTGPTYPPPQPGGLSPVLERNLGWVPVVPAWDPSFVVLAMVAAVEAIFLSTFVLVSQNRMAAAADKRANLDLQVSLLTEHEITQLVTLVSGIADRMGVKTEADADLEEITQDVAPEAVLDELEAAEAEAEQP